MARKLNIIKKQIWKIDLDSTQNSFSIQNEWGQFSQTEISPILDQVCNELINEDKIVKVDKIELDLGKVSFADMEKELPDKVYQAFRESLVQLLTESEGIKDENVAIVSSTHSDLDLINHFLSTGTIPWWASKSTDFNLETIFKKIIAAKKPEVCKLLKAGMHLTAFPKRLVSQFSPELLLSLVEILEPTLAKSIQTLFKMLHKEFHDQRRLSSETDIDSFLWFNILFYIAGNHGEINVEKLAQYVRDALCEKLPKDIVKSKEKKGVIKTDSIPPFSKFELIKSFLVNGIMPSGSSDLAVEDLDNIFKELLAEPNDEIQRFFKEEITSEEFRKRLTSQFSIEQLFSVIEIIEPAYLKTVQTLFKELRENKISEPESDQNTFLWDLIFVFISEKQGKTNWDELRNYARYELKQKWLKEVIKPEVDGSQIESDSLMPLSKLELIKTFLDTGILPAWDADSGKTDLDKLLKDLSDEPKPALKRFLRESIKSEKFRTRLVYHFAPHTILSLIEIISSVRASQIKKASEELLGLIRSKKEHLGKLELETFVWYQLLTSLSSTSSKITEGELVDNVLIAADKKWPELKVKSKKPDDGSSKKDLSDHEKLELIIYFMNTGSLPWWVSRIESQNLPVIFQEILVIPSRKGREFLIQGVKYEWFRKRLTSQYTGEVVYLVIQALEPVRTKRILQLVEELEQMLKVATKESRHDTFTTPFFQAHILSWLGDGHSFIETNKWVASLLKTLSLELKLTYQNVLELLLKQDERTSSKKIESPHSLSFVLEELLKQVKSAGEKTNIPGAPQAKEGPVHQQLIELTETPVKEEVDIPEISQDEDGTIPKEQEKELTDEHLKEPDIETDEYYIENAGLVLLWPYLAKFFEHLKLVENNQFIDKDSIYKAAHLLQYLVTGKREQPEYHFPLNKILCGLDIEEPIPRKLKLKKKEIKACEELLQGVVKNWTALKNTSTDGFREAFLKREGKLTRKDNEWLLKVEQKAYDILMEKLPWSISIVKLPWMPGIMHVEW